MGWIGVDLDGTLARYDGWKGQTHVGEPIPAMVERVRSWLAQGLEVRIVTARVAGRHVHEPEIQRAIRAWCLLHLGAELAVTCEKDYDMVELWDDRAVAVETNTGRALSASRL